ncbi:hypothetical protein, partial [Achromobacter marplatensis]|uniref:hypothetical protein n=1 Tax=Achromobacter marplatensis TaxID=470868 RepID=UPI0035EB41CA
MRAARAAAIGGPRKSRQETKSWQRIEPRQRQPVGGVGLMARNLDAPEGIRREPQADEDDNGEVRSEGSGP